MSLARLLAIAALVGCGPKVAPTWVERERPLGETHAATDTPAAVDVSMLDVGKLDAAAIDALDDASVRAALDKAGDAAPAARLALRAAKLAYHRGDDAEARGMLARAATAADEASVHGELAALAAKVADVAVDPKVVAVLLPLSGKFAAIGSELKTAIELADPQGTKWLFLDTKGEPDAAIAAVEAAYAKGAVAILGPVGSREAIAAAKAASLRRLPIALLSPGDGADPASGVFRLVGSVADEGRAVARIAQQDSFPTVAVFAPRDDVGQEAADAFVEEAKRLGLQVTAQGSYDPTGGELEPDVKKFLNLVPSTNPRLAQHLAKKGKKGWSTFSPDVPFSLLYIPDRYDRAAIVAAFLPYFGVELRTTEFPDQARLMRKHGGHMPQVVQLVGGAGWHHPTLPIRGGAAVQGALIVDVFPGDLGLDASVQFGAAFLQRTGRGASSAAAEAFDAATLVAHARAEATAGSAAPRDPRTAFRTALVRAKLDDGACGEASIDVTGELVREPATLEVQGDQLIVAP